MYPNLPYVLKKFETCTRKYLEICQKYGNPHIYVFVDTTLHWHGERNIADYTTIGEPHSCCGTADAMFDGIVGGTSFHQSVPYMYHANTGSGGCADGGVIITFKSLINYVDLRLFTRGDLHTDQD